MFRIDWAREWSRLDVFSVDFGNGTGLWLARLGRGASEPPLAPLALIDQPTIGI